MSQTCRSKDPGRKYAQISVDVSLWEPGMVCNICGASILEDHYFNRDHMVPMAVGGSRGKKNCVYTHTLCNMVKGDRHPFFLRTARERKQIKYYVRPRTYLLLQELWTSTVDDAPHET